MLQLPSYIHPRLRRRNGGSPDLAPNGCERQDGIFKKAQNWYQKSGGAVYTCTFNICNFSMFNSIKISTLSGGAALKRFSRIDIFFCWNIKWKACQDSTCSTLTGVPVEAFSGSENCSNNYPCLHHLMVSLIEFTLGEYLKNIFYFIYQFYMLSISLSKV